MFRIQFHLVRHFLVDRFLVGKNKLRVVDTFEETKNSPIHLPFCEENCPRAQGKNPTVRNKRGRGTVTKLHDDTQLLDPGGRPGHEDSKGVSIRGPKET